jgi:hypothetical protein
VGRGGVKDPRLLSNGLRQAAPTHPSAGMAPILEAAPQNEKACSGAVRSSGWLAWDAGSSPCSSEVALASLLQSCRSKQSAQLFPWLATFCVTTLCELSMHDPHS